ncbi:MAG: phytoene/squalene synthase family protein [Rhizobacter sp.]|nr:phytoene/squalene synthase family protein [Rhizobacter sp.]
MFGWRPPESQAASTRADLAACRAALRHGSKTFLAASLLLPRGVHEPASALYAFCRLADDAVDAQGACVKSSRSAVERLRERLRLAYAGTPQDDPTDRALAVVVERNHIPAELFDALLEGFEWDLQGRRYDTLADLHDYAARVAGTVGAMMALLMGVRTPEGLARACELGVAMQLSNIARDVGEDARMGRLYLPREWMAEAGLDADAWLAQPAFSPALASVVRRLLDAADVLYDRVGDGVAKLPLACRPGINAARFMYAEIGHEVARRGLDSVSVRAHVSGERKAWLLLRSLVELAPPAAARPLPPLASNRFLVDAALAALPQPVAPLRRGVTERVVWTIELFARLEQRDRQRSDARLRGSDLVT